MESSARRVSVAQATNFSGFASTSACLDRSDWVSPCCLRLQYGQLVEWQTHNLYQSGNSLCWSKRLSFGCLPFSLLTLSQPTLLLAIFCALKLRNRRLWVRLDKTNTALNDVTSNFERNSGIPLTAADDSWGMVMQAVGPSSDLISHGARGGLGHGPEDANSV